MDEQLAVFLEALRKGQQLVIGNRFQGGIQKGAMPFSHRYIGNPCLSWLGRLLFHSRIKDFHCGMRGFERDAIRQLQLTADDMELASEMIAKAERASLRVSQVPVKLYKDGRNGKSHLRTFYHGYRHLHFLISYAWQTKGKK